VGVHFRAPLDLKSAQRHEPNMPSVSLMQNQTEELMSIDDCSSHSAVLYIKRSTGQACLADTAHSLPESQFLRYQHLGSAANTVAGGHQPIIRAEHLKALA